MQNSNSLPWDTEHFKNKSIQRKIFDESVSYHLKGDDDNFDQSLVDNQTSFRTDNQISTNQIGYQDVQNQEQQPNSEIQLDKFQLYSQKSQFSHKLSENSDRNQQVGVINNTSKQKINETSPDSTIKNEKKNENTIFCSLDHQSNLHQVSNMSFNQKNSDLNGSYLSEIEIKNSEKCIQQQNSLRQIKPTQQPKKLSIYNYQKAADIIHNVIGKSANRVQRVDQQVKNFIAVLKSLKQNRRLPQLENEQFLNGSQEKRNSFYFLFNLTENEKHFIRLCNQLIKVISVAHFVSLSWYQLGSYEFQNGYQVSWLQKFDLLELTYLEKYVYSMYWSITTMTTVGYGDISATNYVEATFIIFSMILFSCLFAYSINNIGFILQEIEKSSKQLNDSITTIQRLLSQQNQDICKNLKNQLRNFNTIVEGYFKTELDFLAQISQKDVDKNEQEFQTSTEESSKSLEEEEDIQQYSIDQQQKETILQLNKQKSSIQMRTSEKQRVNSIIQNIENAENLIQNENEQIQNYQMIKNQQSTKTIPNGTFDYTQSKSFSNNEQTSECQKTDAENETFLEEINQGISNQDQLLPCIINSKTQMQKTNSNIKLASNLSSSEINQKVKKQEKNNSKQITYQSKKRMSYDDCQSSNLSDEETIKPIQNSTSKRKSNKNKLGTKKDLQDQISKTSFEILSSLNGNIFKNLVYQNSQNTIQTINTINMQDDAIDDFSKINQDQTHRNKYESNQHSSQQFKQNYSQRNVNFNVNQNDQNENNYVCKSLKVLGLPSQLISNVSNQKEILEQIQDILRKSRKDITSITKYSQRLIDEQQNYNNFSMNNFDKIQFYKRFFPHNNFSHIFNKFSFKKITELKKIRQVKTLVNKGRRNNILMTTVVPRKSLFCNIAQLQNNFPSEINIDSYKPTFLSYGVCCKDFQLYPKSYQNNIIQYEIQQEKQN
ncbi:hypothetical protein ABPG74_007438 [Tetrahymena malaccensis]